MAELVIGIVILVVLVLLLVVIGTTRTRIGKLRSELQESISSLRAEIIAVRTDGEKALARAQAETREEREEREAVEATRREREKKRELDRVAADNDATVAQILRVGMNHGLNIARPTYSLQSIDRLPHWWSLWLENNMNSFSQLWDKLGSEANNGQDVADLSRAFQAVLASFPVDEKNAEFPAAECLLEGIVKYGPDGLLGTVISHRKLVSDGVFKTAQERLAAIRQKERAGSDLYDDPDDGYCCGRSGDYPCLGPRPA